MPVICPICEERTLSCKVDGLDIQPGSVKRNGIELRVTPLQQRIIEILSFKYPNFVPNDSIIMYVWGEDEPEEVNKNIQVHVCRLRKILPKLMLDIDNRYYSGYRLVEGDGRIRVRREGGTSLMWTDDEWEKLKEMQDSGRSLRQMSEELDRTEVSCRAKLFRELGNDAKIRLDHNPPRKWKETEVRKLFHMRESDGMTFEEISKVLDRSSILVRQYYYNNKPGGPRG